MVGAEGILGLSCPNAQSRGTVIGSLLEELFVARVRRQWPVLRLVPSRWIRRVIRPTVVQLRRSLIRGALALAVLVATILTLLTVFS